MSTPTDWTPDNEEDLKREKFFDEFARATVTMKVDFATIFDVLPRFLPWPLNHVVGLLVKLMVNHWMDDLRPIFQILDDALSDEKPWFGGTKICLSDFDTSFRIDTAVQNKWIDTEKYPKLIDWHRRVQEREAYKEALEGGIGYNLVTYGM